VNPDGPTQTTGYLSSIYDQTWFNYGVYNEFSQGEFNTERIIPLMMNPWLLVVLFVLHDGEEVLFLPHWVERNSTTFDELETRFPILQKILPLLRGSDQKQFSFSVLLLAVTLALICGLAAWFPLTVWIQNIFLASLVIFTAHLLIHIGQCFLLRKIIPGALTSLLVFIPSIFLWQHQMSVMNVSFGTSLVYGFIGAIFFLPLFPLILKFGRWAGRSA
jgi:hypothetical protein